MERKVNLTIFFAPCASDIYRFSDIIEDEGSSESIKVNVECTESLVRGVRGVAEADSGDDQSRSKKKTSLW